ncbi:DNA-processing protein DprA [Elioraea rosea]|uniref:DNA-processing protein DprA n=1 Tax=Elioraea rosea TaxID=2492390 RepID=UPI001183BB5F|nr:DNA-processing protein DprA [Elioraea rosea]
MSERLARLRLARAEGLGPGAIRALIAREGGAAAAIEALPRLARGRAVSIPSEEEVRREEERLAAMGAALLLDTDALYPEALAATHDAPLALAVAGEPGHLSRRAVAIVGARNASAGARIIAERLARDLADAGLAVVSGLARGVDTAAHEGALAEGGVTIAAVAGGLDKPYPPQNAALQARIAEGGVVVAEAPLGTAAMAKLFPRRNRIVAGLALGTIVVEAALKSGSLITARMALEAGRELFAVPGSPLDPRARGSNDLLRQGATLVETAEDVLAALPASAPSAPPPRRAREAEPHADTEEAEDDEAVPAADDEASEARRHLQTLLSHTPVSVDEVLRRTPCSAAAVHAALLDLDLEGRLDRLPGNRVALKER